MGKASSHTLTTIGERCVETTQCGLGSERSVWDFARFVMSSTALGGERWLVSLLLRGAQATSAPRSHEEPAPFGVDPNIFARRHLT